MFPGEIQQCLARVLSEYLGMFLIEGDRGSPAVKHCDLRHVLSAHELGSVYLITLCQCWAQEPGALRLKQKLPQLQAALLDLTGVRKLKAKVDLG